VDLSEDAAEEEPNYSLPNPENRYRSNPSFIPSISVERLAQEPRPLSESTTVPTRNGSDNPRITERVGRAWAKNLGAGPTWELMEDRSWFKEPYQDSAQFVQRPVVHSDLEDATHWEQLSPERVESSLVVQ
jgi:transcription factor C subunit 6